MKDWQGVAEFARSYGVAIDAINPNVFQDADFQFGSLSHPQQRVRDKALAHHLECVEIA